ncbi:hypothetical protein [Erythrobacter tepidarius]|uniref:hypothetical protein n=1 Tax=Erythrobacter tepidarius TaxID=60454 RepID=UPI000A3929AD|nr:hypothetical protein [Erythrobacter tepidarius]
MTQVSLLVRLRMLTQRSLFSAERRDAPETIAEREPPLSAERQEAIQRLQIGVFGIAAMVLLVGLASIIGSQADVTEEAAVPDAAPTTEPSPTPSQANPLADAGVVPDIAAEPSPSPVAPLDLPPPAPGNGNQGQ